MNRKKNDCQGNESNSNKLNLNYNVRPTLDRKCKENSQIIVEDSPSDLTEFLKLIDEDNQTELGERSKSVAEVICNDCGFLAKNVHGLNIHIGKGCKNKKINSSKNSQNIQLNKSGLDNINEACLENIDPFSSGRLPCKICIGKSYQIPNGMKIHMAKSHPEIKDLFI